MNALGKEPVLIKLNIEMGYPVKWDMARILRDLLQNFYDAVGKDDFAQRVTYNIVEHEDCCDLQIDTTGTDFGYEWLIYIGASTKTGKKGYVGKYGEGFKMAVLCLYRDYGLCASMESEDWRIEPCGYKSKIDGEKHRMLGYSRYKRKDDGHTRLTVKGIPDRFLSVLRETPLNFYYPQNPLFGEKIYEDEEFGIYRRSDMEIPCRDVTGKPVRGVLYTNYLARGRMSVPVIICINDRAKYVRLISTGSNRKDKRDRAVYQDCQTIEIISETAEHFPPAASYELLCVFEDYWHKLPEKLYDDETWYYLVCQLVRNVASNTKVKKRFMERYANLVYIERETPDRKQKMKVAEIKKWWAECGDKSKRQVIPIFRLLGAVNLGDEYEEVERNSYIKPTAAEERRYGIVMKAAYRMLGFEGDDTPELLICDDREDYYNPDQFASHIHGKGRGSKGIRRSKYHIPTVVLVHDDFDRGCFSNTLVKAFDIALHRFGMSRSETLNALLTKAGSLIIDNREIVDAAREEWNEVDDKADILHV